MAYAICSGGSAIPSAASITQSLGLVFRDGGSGEGKGKGSAASAPCTCIHVLLSLRPRQAVCVCLRPCATGQFDCDYEGDCRPILVYDGWRNKAQKLSIRVSHLETVILFRPPTGDYSRANGPLPWRPHATSLSISWASGDPGQTHRLSLGLAANAASLGGLGPSAPLVVCPQLQ